MPRDIDATGFLTTRRFSTHSLRSFAADVNLLRWAQSSREKSPTKFCETSPMHLGSIANLHTVFGVAPLDDAAISHGSLSCSLFKDPAGPDIKPSPTPT
jgi:hypothetical protein